MSNTWIDQNNEIRLSGTVTGISSYSPPTARQQLFGNNVSVANNAVGVLTWNSSLGPNVLLDRTAPGTPLIITAGVYSLVVLVIADPLTAGGFYECSLDMNLSGDDAALAAITSPSQTAAGRAISVTAALTWYMPAGGDLKVSVRNLDGAATRNYSLSQAVLQRLS